MLEHEKFLGRGWSFPPTFRSRKAESDSVQSTSSRRKAESGVVLVEAKEDIDQSLHILLSTSLGERIMQPEYGCNLSDYQFEPMSSTLIGRIRDLVSNAILYYEPRIKVEKIDISSSGSNEAIEGKLLIEVTYFIRTTNSRFNFVYDFYLKESSQAA